MLRALIIDDADALSKIIDDGVNIDILVYNQWTPLAFACLSSSIECVHLLISSGADVNLASGGWTPLHWACKYNNMKIVIALIEAGATPSIESNGELFPSDLTTDPEIKTLLDSYSGGRATKAATK